ncbi:substrate-binding domain-containing protein [Arundinibacter roseus]|uniref:Phosphate ABC transporter substrate-binding protein n=1 Tax=Arundinibacter roseus TaxID=2070510 RepID=A0A4R4K8H7_9BACT|nr:substrate-binding domain-containing protein [Arundinibacter roseus]TDB62751.1 phosphate ABC transporter substrate-binding protein [Arundinibacter roseus]
MKHYVWLIFLLCLACTRDKSAIRVKGSDTEVNLAVVLAESFHEATPGVFISISGGGSGLGISSLLNGTTDIANSSRSLNEEERLLFDEKKVTLDSFIFAQDAIAFVVSDNLPIDSLSTQELAGILSGEISNWNKVSKKNMPITIYGRQSNSGTHDFVRNRLSIRFSPQAMEMNGNSQILEAIKSDNSGIGYVGAGYVQEKGQQGIKVLSIYEQGKDAISPFNACLIAEGKYVFQRPLFQYFKADSYVKIKPFLDFEKSEQGKKIIQQAGYYPVNETR